MNKTKILLFLLFIFSLNVNADIYYVNGGLSQSNVSFPLFDSIGNYIGDTLIVSIGAGDNGTGTANDISLPYADFTTPLGLTSDGDEIWVFSYGDNDIDSYQIESPITTVTINNIKSNSAKVYVKDNGIIDGDTIMVVGFNFVYGGSPSSLFMLVAQFGKLIFNYNIVQGGFYYTQNPLYIYTNISSETSYLKNNYFYGISTTSIGFISYSVCDISRNVFRNYNQTLVSSTNYGLIDNANYVSNNYFYQCNTLCANLINITGANVDNYFNDCTINPSSSDYKAFSSGQDLLIIDGDTSYYNASDTAGFDATGISFFSTYGIPYPSTGFTFGLITENLYSKYSQIKKLNKNFTFNINDNQNVILNKIATEILGDKPVLSEQLRSDIDWNKKMILINDNY